MSNPPYVRIVRVSVIVTLLTLFVSHEAPAQQFPTEDGSENSFRTVSEFVSTRPIAVVIAALLMALWISLAVRNIRSLDKPAKTPAENPATSRIPDIFRQVIDVSREIVSSGMAPVVLSTGVFVTSEIAAPSTPIATQEQVYKAIKGATLEALKDSEIREQIAIAALIAWEKPEIQQTIDEAIGDALKLNYGDLEAEVERAVLITSRDAFDEFIRRLSTLYAIQPVLRSSLPETEAPTQ